MLTKVARKRGMLLPALLAVALSGCGSSGLNGLQDDGTAPAAALGQRVEREGFTLQILPETFAPGGANAEFGLAVEPQPAGGVRVSVLASGASALKALYFTLDYDSARYSALEATASGELAGKQGGGSADSLLELAYLNEPGSVQHGQVLSGWDDRDGFSGAAVLATINLGAGQSLPAVQREVSNVPATAAAAAPLALSRYSSAAMQLDWFYTNPGDYDQNGEVSITDLTPLGQHFGETTTTGFDFRTLQAVIDGDGNGEINIADLTVIGSGFGNRIESWNIYESSDPAAEYPAAPTDASATPPQFAQHEPSSAAGMRLGYSFLLEGADGSKTYWVRPVFAGSEGTPSNRSDQSNGLGNQPPMVFFELSATSGELPLDLTVDATQSYDPDGTLNIYTFSLSPEHIVNTVGEATIQRALTYNTNYNVVVFATDNDGLESYAAAQLVQVTHNGNAAPVAVMDVLSTDGDAPLELLVDMSASTDLNGIGDISNYSLTIYQHYEEGIPSLDNGTDPLFSLTLDEPGLYTIIGTVMDAAGTGSTTAPAYIEVLGNGNMAPRADLNVVGNSGNEVPVTVTFDYSASYDPDGSLVKYELSPLGDYEFIELTDADHTFDYTYTEAGMYKPVLVVTDDGGLLDIISMTLPLEISGDNGTYPQAQLTATPDSGEPGVSVFLDAGASFDPNGVIVSYQFDFGEGAGFQFFDEGTNITHVYESPGDYSAQVMVTDNQGLSSSASTAIHIAEPVNLPPVAVFSADPDSGLISVTSTLDASASSDPDGQIVKYEYLFGIGGMWEDNGTNPVLVREFNSLGSHLVKLRVTDDGGLTAEASHVITVSQFEL